MSEEEIRESVDEAKAPGTFNIMAVLKDRGYPKDKITVFIDEEMAYEAAKLKEELDSIDSKNKTESAKKNRADLADKIDEIREQLAKSAYVIHLEGISEGKREEIYREAKKKYPIEYENDNSVQSILSGGKRTEKESPERDALFTDYLWQAHIKKIVDPEGNEQVEIPFATIRAMRDSLPVSAIIKVNESIEKLRTATAVFIMETGEDFLAKP